MPAPPTQEELEAIYEAIRTYIAAKRKGEELNRRIVAPRATVEPAPPPPPEALSSIPPPRNILPVAVPQIAPQRAPIVTSPPPVRSFTRGEGRFQPRRFEDLSDEEWAYLGREPTSEKLANLGLIAPLTPFQRAPGQSIGATALRALHVPLAPIEAIQKEIVEPAATTLYNIPGLIRGDVKFARPSYARRQAEVAKYKEEAPLATRIALETLVGLPIPATPLETSIGRGVGAGLGAVKRAVQRGARVAGAPPVPPGPLPPLTRNIPTAPAREERISAVLFDNDYPDGVVLEGPATPELRATFAQAEAEGTGKILPTGYSEADLRAAKDALGLPTEASFTKGEGPEIKQALPSEIETISREAASMEEYVAGQKPLADLATRENMEKNLEALVNAKALARETLHKTEARSGQAYREALAPARHVYDEARALERQASSTVAYAARQQDTAAAKQAYDAIRDAAQQTYDQDIAPAEQAFQEANDAVERALKEVNDAARAAAEVAKMETVPEGVSPAVRPPEVEGVRLPMPEPGMPEAGVQAGMLGVPERPFTPRGRGKPTTISMDEQLKLQQMREAAVPAAKEPWQMRRVDYAEQVDPRWNMYDTSNTPGGRAFYAHKDLVRQALAEGKPVPPEVLAGYPDLATQVRGTVPEPPRRPPIPPLDVGGRAGPPMPPPPSVGGGARAAPLLPELPTMDDVLTTNFRENWLRKLGSAAANVPGIKQTIGKQLNPSLLAKTPADRAVIAYRGLQDASDTAVVGAMAQLRAMGRVWEVDAVGKALNVKVPEGMSPYIGDILTHPHLYPLSREQRHWTDIAHELLETRFARLRAKGIDIGELTFDEPENAISMVIQTGPIRGRYFPRIPLKVEAPGLKPLKIGRIQSQLASRSFPTQELGVAAGIHYMPDPSDTLELTLKAAYRLERDKMFSDYVRNEAKAAVRGLPPTHIARRVPGFERFTGDFRLPTEWANAIEEHFQDTGQLWLRTAGNIADVSRVLGTGFDPGYGLIQGSLILASNPKAWGRAVAKSFEVLFSPKTMHKYMTDNIDTIQRMVDAQSAPLQSGAADIIGLERGGLLRKVPGVRPVVDRATEMFNSFMDVGRIELHKAWADRATTDVEYRRLTNVIDHLSGISSSRALGVGATRRQIEGAFILFAPRYRRAVAALMTDIASGGVAGQLAARAVAALTLGGMAVTSAIAMGLGQEDRVLTPGRNGIPLMFDPTTSGFMTVEIAGRNVGIGGGVRSMVGQAGRLAAGIRGQQAMPGGVLGAVEAVKRNVRGTASPIGSLAFDVIGGKSFMGEDIDLTNPRDVGQLVANRTLPFAVQGYVEAALDPTVDMPGPVAGAAGYVGLREFPVSEFQTQRERRDKMAAGSGLKTQEGQPVQKWEQLNVTQKRELGRSSPELQEQTERVETLGQRTMGKAERQRTSVEEKGRVKFEGDMEVNAVHLANGLISRKEYDEKVDDLRNRYRGVTGTLWELRLASEGKTEAEMKAEIRKRAKPEDVAYGDYWDEYFAQRERMGPHMDSKAWKALDVYMRKWLEARYSPQIVQYVLARRNDWINDLPPAAREMETKAQAERDSGRWFKGGYDKTAKEQMRDLLPPPRW